MSEKPKKSPQELLNLAIMALAIIGGLATVISCVIAFISFVTPNQVKEFIVNIYAVQTPSPEIQVIEVTNPPPPPLPTYTPYPTYTPLSPIATNTSPAVTQVSNSSFPFVDDFESGINPKWEFVGEGFAASNGKLVVEGWIEGFVGDASWTDYAIILDGRESSNTKDFQIRVRMQDKDNYMVFRCQGNDCNWYKVVNGESVKIPGTGSGWGVPRLKIEVDSNVYRTFLGTEQVVYFIDDTFNNGGMGLIFSGNHIEISRIEITTIK